MREYLCECKVCKLQKQVKFEGEPYPIFGDEFECFCPRCNRISPYGRVLTRKARAQLNRLQTEKELKRSIVDQCARYGFRCRFLYQSVIITTPLADWCFDYHQSKKTLYHESTVKINFETGKPCKSHCQFRNKKRKVSEVIDYIAAHEKWRLQGK